MRLPSVFTTSGIGILAAWLLCAEARPAFAAPVTIDRERLQMQLQTLTQQVAIAQQQLDQSPHAHGQLMATVQQLQAVQTQLGELQRQLAMAPPAGPPQYQPPQYQPQPPVAPQYQPAPPPQYQPQPPVAVPQYQPPPPEPQPGNVMADANLRTMLQQISGGYSNDKLNILRQAVVGNAFLVEQAARILPLFVYTSDRVAALRILAPLLVDRQNSFKLLSQFQYSDDRETAQRILHGGAPPPPPPPVLY